MTSAKIDWVNGKPREAVAAHVPWLEAVKAADRGDTAALTKLLCSAAALGPVVSNSPLFDPGLTIC